MRGLLIAEKPSAMRAVKEVYEKEKGFPDKLEFAAFHGHLMELKAPEDYNPKASDWENVSLLPIIPAAFQYKASDEKSVNSLIARIKSGNYDFIVNACDAGREGEHIFWSFYETAGLSIPIKRLWTSSLTKPAIKQALYNLKDATLYNGLRQAAKYRAQFDWLVGMNFTRAATTQLRRLTSIGRIQSPTLKLIVDRELAIQNFKPSDFFELKTVFEINGQKADFIHLIAPDHKETRFSSQKAALQVLDDVKKIGSGSVAGRKDVVKSVEAPTLYSLVELQKDANKYLKLKANETLAIAQTLYEKGLLSYPRTESRYLPTDMIPEIPAHISPLSAVPELAQYVAAIGQKEVDEVVKKHYVDDAGITDHHAIIPTDQTPNWGTLNKNEQAVYSLVGKAFLAIFMPPYKTEISTVLVSVGPYLFRAQGRVDVDKGYSILYPRVQKDEQSIPPCKKGDKVDIINQKISKSTTKPPARYTPRTILAAMQNAGQELPDSTMRSVLRDSAGLGTSATRADILEKLEKRGYVEVKANAFYALPKGINLIQDIGDRRFCSALLTAEWEAKLLDIEKGQYGGNFEQEMDTYIHEETKYILLTLNPNFGAEIGTCPFCKGVVRDYGRLIACENSEHSETSSCNMRIFRNIAGYELTKEDVVNLLAGKPIGPINFSTKGKAWRANLVLNKEQGMKFEFEKSVLVSKCPICGGSIIQTANGYLCEHRKKDDPDSCEFWLPRSVGGVPLTEQDITALLSGKLTESHTVKTKTGKDWMVCYYLDADKKFQTKSMEKQVVVGRCPLCQATVYAAENNFYCGAKNGQVCEWSFPRVVKGASLKDSDMTAMLEGKKTRMLSFTWSNGSKGKAQLYLEKSKLKWSFPDV